MCVFLWRVIWMVYEMNMKFSYTVFAGNVVLFGDVKSNIR